MRNPHLAFLIVLTVLAGCTPRGAIRFDLDAGDVGTVRSIYFSTTREASEEPGLLYGTRRVETPNYGRIDLSVPPDRLPGQVSYPGRDPNPQTDFLATRHFSYENSNAFRQDLSADLRSRPRGDRDVIIFVHGFNSTFAEGMIRLAQLKEDLSLPGVAVHYSWPSLSNPLGYSYDRDSALFGRDGLEQLLHQVTQSGAEDVILVGHSLGSLLVMETLRQMEIAEDGSAVKATQGVVLMSPDLDVDLFLNQAHRIGDLPEPFLIFSSQRDRALQLSARLTGQRERLGNLSDVERVADLEVTMLDVTSFEDGTRHLTPATSPTLLALLRELRQVDAAFQGDQAGRTGLFPGTVLTVQNATEIILSPLTGSIQ